MTATLALLALFLLPMVPTARSLLGRRWPWFLTPMGGAYTAIVMASLLALAEALVSGKPITGETIAVAIGAAITSGGGWKYLQVLIWDPTQKKIAELQAKTPPPPVAEGGPRVSLVRAAQALPPVPPPKVWVRPPTGELQRPDPEEGPGT